MNPRVCHVEVAALDRCAVSRQRRRRRWAAELLTEEPDTWAWVTDAITKARRALDI